MIKYLIIVLSCVLLNVSVSCQQKIAYVDVESIIKGLDAYKQIQMDLEIYQQQLVRQLDKEKKAIAAYYKQVLRDIQVGKLTPKQQQEAESKLQQQQIELEKNTEEVDRKLLQRQQTLTRPLYDTFEKALVSEAEKKNIAYILDAKTIMHSYQAIDLTKSIQKYFNK
jgi:outer membrane protein